MLTSSSIHDKIRQAMGSSIIYAVEESKNPCGYFSKNESICFVNESYIKTIEHNKTGIVSNPYFEKTNFSQIFSFETKTESIYDVLKKNTYFNKYNFEILPCIAENKSCLGTIFQGFDILENNSRLFYGLRQLFTGKKRPHSTLPMKNEYKNYKLSSDEKELLFLLSVGYEKEKIAIQVNKSLIEVNNIIKSLCITFNVETVHNLIDLAWSVGLVDNIPERLRKYKIDLL